jgi:hypothetical protein
MNRITCLGLGSLVWVALACGGGGDDSYGAGAESDYESTSSVAPGASEGSRAPTIRSVSLSPVVPKSGDTLRAVVEVDSRGVAGYRLDYTWDVAGNRVKGNRGSITLPTLRRDDRISVRVVASNDYGTSETLSAQTSVSNEPPKILDLRLGEQTDPESGDVQWVAEAWGQDPDGDPVEYRYAWFVNDMQTGDQEKTFATSKLKRGDRVRVQVVASDGDRESATAESGTIQVANASPDITSTPPQLDASGAFTYQVEVTDPDGDPSFAYELVSGPRGMKMDSYSGLITWKPEPNQAGDNHVEIAVDDRKGGRATQVFTIPIVVKSLDDAPAAIR